MELDREVQEEFDRLESLKELLAKTSVAVTYQGSPQAKPRTVKEQGCQRALYTEKLEVGNLGIFINILQKADRDIL